MDYKLRLSRYTPHPPEPPQIAFLLLDHEEAFYGGAAGGGKSDALLMAALQYVDEPGYAALILRRTFQDLALPGAIMSRSKQWLQGKGVHWNEDRKTWTFPSGATLTFGYLKHADDVYQYQGAELQFVGFDELTQFTEDQYTYLFSRLRRLADSDIPVRMRSASNPGNIGHNWVKRRFITERKRGVVFIPAKLSDNPHLDQESYRRGLKHLSPVLQQQLLDGDWGAFEGAAYPDFDEAVHVVEAFEVPDSWERFEFMDFGSTNPTAWYVAGVDHDGNVLVFDEYYSPGLVSDHAPAILERRSRWWARDERGEPVAVPVFPDPSIRNRYGMTARSGSALSIEAEFQEYGFSFSQSNNDRRAGYLRIAELLRPDPARFAPRWANMPDTQPSPQLFLTRRCQHLIDQLRTAPIEDDGPARGEAVDGKWESAYGHAHAALRYGALSRTSRPDPLLVVPDDPRQDFLDRWVVELERPRRSLIPIE